MIESAGGGGGGWTLREDSRITLSRSQGGVVVENMGFGGE